MERLLNTNNQDKHSLNLIAYQPCKTVIVLILQINSLLKVTMLPNKKLGS